MPKPSRMPRMLPLLAVAATAALLTSCGSEEKSSRGLELMPDMFHSPAHKSQTAIRREVVAADGSVTVYESSAMLTPVPGTVPRSGAPYAIAVTDWASAKRLVNPLAPTKAVIRLGQERYNQTCAMCHGRDGDATHGNMAKYFSGIPSVNTANVAGMTEGEVFHIVTVGRNRMPHLRSQLLPAERWAVTGYVQALARATIAANDAKGLVDSAWNAAQSSPSDPAAAEALAKAKLVVAQRDADLAAIQALGSPAEAKEAAEAFAPLPEPEVEGGDPVWPSQSPAAAQHSGE